MGMMNNPHFRVKMAPRSGSNGELNLACEHPTKQGSEPGGWMEREVAGAREAEAAALAAELEKKNNVDESKLRMYSLEEVGVFILMWSLVELDPCRIVAIAGKMPMHSVEVPPGAGWSSNFSVDFRFFADHQTSQDTHQCQ